VSPSQVLSRAVLALVLAMALPVLAAEREANAIFLIASRDLKDPNFREAVVLVTQPQRGGPWGVIINRPLNRRLSEVFTDQESLKGSEDVVFFGGPVEREGLVFVVRSDSPPARAVPLLRDVYFTGDVEWIESQFQRSEPTRGMRVYAGHSGWAPGQLQREITRGGWHIYPADAETVFEKDPSRIWPELIERATSKPVRFQRGD
jgi:putative transcriptional regulator